VHVVIGRTEFGNKMNKKDLIQGLSRCSRNDVAATLCTVELGYNVMNRTEYFVSF
jgi:hypothetical protein